MSDSAAKRHRRKTRRKWKAVYRHGRKAGPTHKLIGGRTGSLHHKRMKAKRYAAMRTGD